MPIFAYKILHIVSVCMKIIPRIYIGLLVLLLFLSGYKAAVGGTQGLDMNFNYHISVLKSPLPFKAGVNITGNLDKMKIRIGKAKYKDAVTPVEIRKVDSTRVNMGQEIIHSFERVISRTYRGKLPQGAE